MAPAQQLASSMFMLAKKRLPVRRYPVATSHYSRQAVAGIFSLIFLLFDARSQVCESARQTMNDSEEKNIQHFSYSIFNTKIQDTEKNVYIADDDSHASKPKLARIIAIT